MGIPRDVLPTIFEPFVTTKGETGTGLGLWVTTEILKCNRWRIRVRSCSNPGRSGTIFSIVIPALGRSKAEQRTPVPANRLPQRFNPRNAAAQALIRVKYTFTLQAGTPSCLCR